MINDNVVFLFVCVLVYFWLSGEVIKLPSTQAKSTTNLYSGAPQDVCAATWPDISYVLKQFTRHTHTQCRKKQQTDNPTDTFHFITCWPSTALTAKRLFFRIHYYLYSWRHHAPICLVCLSLESGQSPNALKSVYM